MLNKNNCKVSEKDLEKKKNVKNHMQRMHNSNLTVVRRSNKVLAASNLPKVMNLNPRSIYNKVDEFVCFVEEEDIDIVCISESHERAYPDKNGKRQTLQETIFIEDHIVISNPHQRTGKGGRPAIVANNRKYNVTDLQKDNVITIPWGVEAVWAEIELKDTNRTSTVQKIVVGSIYSKPNSRAKTKLLDHIAEVYNHMSTKHQGLHWIICGDTNDLKIDPILHLSKTMRQVVNTPTRKDPVHNTEKVLDTIITTLSAMYQEPKVLPPLDKDPDKDGKPADHKIVVMQPVNVIFNNPARTKRKLTVRPMPESGMNKLRMLLETASWDKLFAAKTAHEKATLFQNQIMKLCNEAIPQRNINVSSDDQPFYTNKLDQLNRKKKREYSKRRKSLKWQELNKKFKSKLNIAKRKFYKTKVEHLKKSKPGNWYKELKHLCSYDQMKTEPIIVNSINHLNDLEQAEIIADTFANVRNEGFEPLVKSDINIPAFNKCDIPEISISKVKLQLSQLDVKRGQVKDDIPARVLKEFSTQVAAPLTDIINTCITRGEWPDSWKLEVATPIPKEYPPKDVSKLRNISGLKICDKIAEKLISELIVSDMKDKLDPSQYANQPGVSTEHYLIKLIHRILSETDSNTKGEIKAVLATLIDWKQAFPKQCPKLGIESF